MKLHAELSTMDIHSVRVQHAVITWALFNSHPHRRLYRRFKIPVYPIQSLEYTPKI